MLADASVSSVNAITAVLALAILVAGVGFSRIYAMWKLTLAANDEYRAEINQLRDARSSDRRECDRQIGVLEGRVETLQTLVTADIARHVVIGVRELMKESI